MSRQRRVEYLDVAGCPCDTGQCVRRAVVEWRAEVITRRATVAAWHLHVHYVDHGTSTRGVNVTARSMLCVLWGERLQPEHVERTSCRCAHTRVRAGVKGESSHHVAACCAQWTRLHCVDVVVAPSCARSAALSAEVEHVAVSRPLRSSAATVTVTRTQLCTQSAQ